MDEHDTKNRLMAIGLTEDMAQRVLDSPDNDERSIEAFLRACERDE